jgi:hypothetical protein
MAGRPKHRAQIVTLDNAGPEDVLARVAEGETVKAIAESLGVRRQEFYMWIKKRGLTEQFQEAKKLSAEEAVDLATARIEKATPESISVDREYVKLAMWRASHLDRDQWGDRPTVAIQINGPEAFVQAMRLGIVDQSEQIKREGEG